MFEKEAEDSFRCKKVLYKWETDKHSYIDGFKDGAEFGYNKAFVEADKNLKAIVADFNKDNEWHYVKDGDLPNTETKNYTYIRRRKRYERQFTDYRAIKCFVLFLSEKGKTTAKVGYFDCNQKCFLDESEGMVYA